MRDLTTDALPSESVVSDEQAEEHSIEGGIQDFYADEQGDEPDPKRKPMVNEPLTAKSIQSWNCCFVYSNMLPTKGTKTVIEVPTAGKKFLATRFQSSGEAGCPRPR